MSCFSNFGYNKSKFWQRNQKQFINNLLNNSTLWQSPFHIHPYQMNVNARIKCPTRRKLIHNLLTCIVVFLKFISVLCWTQTSNVPACVFVQFSETWMNGTNKSKCYDHQHKYHINVLYDHQHQYHIKHQCTLQSIQSFTKTTTSNT